MGRHGRYVDLGRGRSCDGYPAQVVFADPITEVPGCAADTIGP
jgi:hypothetical protein